MPYYEGQQVIRHWRSSPAPLNVGPGTSQSQWWLAPLDIDGEPFPGNLLANTFAVAMSYNWTATSVSQQLSSTLRIALYTRDGSTLNLVNSASRSFGNTNASTANSSRHHGVRFLTVGTGDWSKTPIFQEGKRYVIGFQLLTHITTTSASWMNAVSFQTAFSGEIGAGGAPNATHHPFSPFRGVYTATTTGAPPTIQASQVTGSGASMSFAPFIRIDNDFKNWA